MDEKKLVQIPLKEIKIPKDVYDSIEPVIREELGKQANPDEFFEPYIYPFEKIKEIAESDNVEYKENIRKMADDLWNQEEWLNALIVFYILMHIVEFLPTDFYKLAYTLGKLKKDDIAVKIAPVYEKLSTNKRVTYRALANFYYCSVDLPEKAVEYFEKYIELDDKNALIYNSVGHLYPRIDKVNGQNKQLEAFKKSYELAPENSVVVKSLLTAYEKMHDTLKIKEFYPKLLKLAPSPRHSLNYGIYLISWGEMQEGCKYMTERFDLDKYPIGYPKNILPIATKWNYKSDISDKTLIVHYEEGFGDSIMYSRFLPLIKQYAKNIILVIQKPLFELFKTSDKISNDIEIFTEINEVFNKYPSLDYVHIPMLDLPYPLGVDTTFIPYSEKYLDAVEIKKYPENKINIGIAYSGDVDANYSGRDIDLALFSNFANIDKVQLYSLQVGEASKQLNNLSNNIEIIDLGKDFKTFSDTATAISGLDLVITTDNVILNLAGALGVKTYGLFNKYPNYRWFDLSGEDVVWYKSVKPFVCENENGWEELINRVAEYFKKEFLHE